MPKQLSPEDQRLWNEVMATTIPLNQVQVLNATAHKLKKVEPRCFYHVLDLHGKTIEGAYKCVRDQIDQAKTYDQKYLTIITGKSGMISSEFSHWIEQFQSEWKIVPSDNKAVWKFKKRR